MPVSVDGFIVLDIVDKKYTLTGSFSKFKPPGGTKEASGIVVEYHKPFNEAITLGSIDDIIVVVGDQLVGSGGGVSFQTQWWGQGGSSTSPTEDSTLGRIKVVPAIGGVITQVLAAQIRITDLGINTITSTYQFGFAFDFTNLNNGKGLTLLDNVPLSIQALGAKITYQKAATAPSGPGPS